MLNKYFFGIFFLVTQMAFAGSDTVQNFQVLSEETENDNDVVEKRCHRRRCHSDNKCQLGVAGFSGGPNDWYEINTLSYPDVVPLSQFRNYGSYQGKIWLTPQGLIINEPGNYYVTITSILQNNDPENTVFIPTFLAINGIFNPGDTTGLGAVASLPPGLIITAQGSGILQNVQAGTLLSIVAANGGNPNPIPVTVVSWGINVFKIPCKN